MSELTKCNYCMLRNMARRAADVNAIVEARRVPITEEMGGWYRVYQIDSKGREEPTGALFMTIGDRCEC